MRRRPRRPRRGSPCPARALGARRRPSARAPSAPHSRRRAAPLGRRAAPGRRPRRPRRSAPACTARSHAAARTGTSPRAARRAGRPLPHRTAARRAHTSRGRSCDCAGRKASPTIAGRGCSGQRRIVCARAQHLHTACCTCACASASTPASSISSDASRSRYSPFSTREAFTPPPSASKVLQSSTQAAAPSTPRARWAPARLARSVARRARISPALSGAPSGRS
eukprot:3322988-Prymnesium_polylepis.1